jgi:ribose transport system permease protein
MDLASKNANTSVKKVGEFISEKILSNRTLMAFIGLMLIATMLSIISPYFLTKNNILNVLRQISIIGIISIGMTYVIITGGINLAVGSILALSATVSALLMFGGLSIALSIFVGIFVGIICGLISGLFIVKIKMPPFIATLAIQTIARGVTLVVTGGMPLYGLPEGFKFLGGGYALGIPVPVIIMIFLYLIGIYFLNYTKTGLYLFAVGGNDEAALLSGVNTGKIRITAYIISGALSAIGGVILASRIVSVEPTMGMGYELDCIASAVIGGTMMSGGVGNLIGTFIGALIMGVLRNGLNLLDVSVYWQQVVIGVVIALTVGLGTMRKK